MALFSLFEGKKVANSDVAPVAIDNVQDMKEENGSPIEKIENDSGKKNLVTIVWGTEMPIDVIFNYIHKNFEEEGFQDALVNCDISYRDTKETIIRNDLEMLFKRIILRYKNDIREIEVNIDNAHKAYALAAASLLLARKKTYEEHLEEINEMQGLLEKNDPKMLTMIESYRRGFQKGMAAVAINFINNQ